ncbi:MAG: hypothetical protein QE263_07600 [Vampirovibrionales bacterium]|nr:hypothetical protein [Vampirovibrionales bacterium]
MEQRSPQGFTLPTDTFTSAGPSLPMEEYRELRWYDQNMYTAKAVQALLTFPDALQNMVCQTLLTILAQQPNAPQPKAKGILSLYRSRQKQHPSDQRQLTHSTLATIGQLPDPRRQPMVQTIHDLTTGFRDYLKLCKQYQATPNAAEARHLLGLYLSDGVKGCYKGLQNLSQQHQERHQTKTQQQLFRSVPAPHIATLSKKR